MNIVISINSNFVMPAVVMLTSLFENNIYESIDIYVLHSSLSIKDKIKLKNCINKYNKKRIIFKKVKSNVFKGAPLGHHFTIETYYRILIQNLLPSNLERVLYLDADIIVNKSITSFYWHYLGNYPFIVCEDMCSKKVKEETCKKLGIPLYRKYFNAGVMIYNLKWIRENINVDDILIYIKYNKNKVTWVDQDVLNALFYDKVKFEECKIYNCQVNFICYRKNKNSIYKKAKILHYSTSWKPWKYNYTGEIDNIFWRYAWKAGYKIDFFRYKIFNYIYKLYSCNPYKMLK